MAANSTGSFTNKSVLVTGAGNGIGREIALRFAGEGARVFTVDIDEAGNRETARLVGQAGGQCEPLAGDVSSAADVRAAVAAAGDLDVLVNNAADVAGDGFLHQVSEESWDRLLGVCLKSVYLFSREALPSMIKRRRGVILSISSVNALTGVHLAAYTAAKGGILSLTRLMARQYGGYGIRVNAISPGTILTESSRAAYDAAPRLREELRALYTGREFGESGDIAAATLFLASPAAKFINGANLVVDGGMTAMHLLHSLDPEA